MNNLISLINYLPEPLTVRMAKFFLDYKVIKYARIQLTGLEHLSGGLTRPCLFVCNHLSNADGVILNKVLEQEKLTFVAGKKLGENSFTNIGLKVVKTIPIMPNSADRAAIKQVVATVREGGSVLVFPEGTRSRTGTLQEGKKGILLFARMTGAPIVPIGLWGTEKLLPISEDMGREKFYAADVHINIGEAFTLDERPEGRDKEDWNDACMNTIMTSISRLLPEEYRGKNAGNFLPAAKP
jgi:1-acyl-sn-glycerol-3-phosphate acyltransferase